MKDSSGSERVRRPAYIAVPPPLFFSRKIQFALGDHMLLLLLLLSHFIRDQLCATSETAAHQAPPSLGFSRQEYWSGVPLPSPGRSHAVNIRAVAMIKGC